VVDAALDAGVVHFDTADVYGDGLSEEFLGRALGTRRQDVAITSKFGAAPPPDGMRPGSASWVRLACEGSLARLGTDWIDLYLLHHPDPGTPIRETLEALTELQAAGLVREIGCSNFDPAQLEEAAAAAAELGISGFQGVQNSYSLLDRTPEEALVPVCLELGVVLIPYMPLASGLLTGKYRASQSSPPTGRLGLTLRGKRVSDYMPGLLTEDCFEIVAGLERYAAERAHTLIELALGWLVSKSYVASVIAGATSADQLRANVAATQAWVLSDQEQRDVAALTRPDVAYTWNVGFPAYAGVPDGVDATLLPDVRVEH